uniref:BTB domain-containing protein n=1 Tax=Panagrolaimus sp. JU765 TaxID=591449 RepID=A0AC34RED8_9BILA
MVLQIVQKSRFIVPADSIGENKRFTSRRQKIPVFNGYAKYVLCEEKNKNIGIFLYMDCKEPVTVTCTFTVNSITCSYVYTFEGPEYRGYSKFGKKSELVVDGVMIVDAKLNIKFIFENVEFFDDELTHSVALLNDEKFKDFTIYVDDDEIKVHKSILAVASPVFAAMFESHTKEGRVDIDDFDFETVKVAVDVMYTRKIPEELSLKTLLNLYKFADKYDLIDTVRLS